MKGQAKIFIPSSNYLLLQDYRAVANFVGFHSGDDLMMQIRISMEKPFLAVTDVVASKYRHQYLGFEQNLKGSWFEAWQDKKRVRKAPNRCRF